MVKVVKEVPKPAPSRSYITGFEGRARIRYVASEGFFITYYPGDDAEFDDEYAEAEDEDAIGSYIGDLAMLDKIKFLDGLKQLIMESNTKGKK